MTTQHPNNKIRCATYLSDVMEPNRLQHTVSKLLQFIPTTGIQFDAVAFRGISGAMVAPTLCIMMDKFPLLVCKLDNNHSGKKWEGLERECNYIIVDDYRLNRLNSR